ncbi:ATP-binding protein [Haloarchaeobius iranensis]|uniref:histidine kinase n=1 Tax=Haloarchaeobius iranensis TaxID=996166 RepID=A0A1G9U9Y6_9EURY|nr:ATP-binding protein [Haloarchaeobius iranensis]SDM56708.1 PAS fold-containing protein [Haloarchaeobius iranensis]
MGDDTLQTDLEGLVQHAPGLAMVIGRDARIRRTSEPVEQVLGYVPAELTDRHLGEYVHPADRAAAIATVSEPGDPTDEPTECRLATVDDGWARVRVVPSAGPNGGYVIVDGTDTGQPDDGRTALPEGTSDGFLAVDGDRVVTRLDDRAVELLGRGREQLVGDALATGLQDEAGETLDDRLATAIATGDSASFDLDYGPTGSLLAVQVYPSGDGATVSLRDVTEERRVATELEESVAALHQLYKLASNTELSFEEKQSRVLELGRSYLGLPYGFVSKTDDSTQHIVTATGDHELLQPGESCPIERSYCRKTVETDGILAMHDALAAEIGPDDPAYELFELGAYVGGKLVVDGGLYGTLCFAATAPRDREFTGSERAFVEVASRWLAYEVERHEYQAQLEERNERLAEFASFVSHDLRNPLNVAEGELELAMTAVENEHLEEVAWAHERMRELIQDLLSVARGGDEVQDPSTVDLPSSVDVCWRNVETDQATLVVEATGVVEADEGRLRQLFENLFRNAVEHGSSDAGSATRDAEQAGADVTVTVGDLPDGFYVADDGPGIPEDERDQVFEAGYTTAADGTGFGLRIVEQVAQAHGWTVTVTGSAAGGARFEFTGVDGR